ncbi:cytidylate kinase [Microgenomates group bacterium RIFCSPLOWO2_01_FULL_47_10]|nr:MAG: cytidylate kinase [Microgenomates group bacterium RIFCSPLOWO2_01_FULL_47_10]
MKKRVIQIAIDGPVAAGKSTVAKKLADALGYLYVDTGAMYRALALYAEQNGVSWENESAVGELARKASILLKKPAAKKKDGRSVSVYLSGVDVSWQIRDSHMAEGASVVSQYKKVREVLVRKQQAMAKGESVVMEGRDIGLRVLPAAVLKIFMTADVDARVKRKWEYLKKRGTLLTKQQAKEDLMRRDEREMHRLIDPLKPVAGAWRLDTTGMKIEEVVEMIRQRVNKIS